MSRPVGNQNQQNNHQLGANNALAMHRRTKLNQLRQTTMGGMGTLRLNGQQIANLGIPQSPPNAPRPGSNAGKVSPGAQGSPKQQNTRQQQQQQALRQQALQQQQQLGPPPLPVGAVPNPPQGRNIAPGSKHFTGGNEDYVDGEDNSPRQDLQSQQQQQQQQGPPPPSPRPLSEFVTTSDTLLGTGAFGAVYLGAHNETGAMIAVKKINIGCNNSEESVNQIDQLVGEIHLMRQLDHPNIVKYLHAERQKNTLCIFMEYVSGGTLTSFCRKMGGRLPPGVARAYMRSALLGVQYLHRKNIVHRDIKADNILVTGSGEAKLSDFGTSREFNDSANLLTVTGTPWFMAPEVVKGSGHGAAADIWSIGTTMLHLLTGEVPFSSVENPVAVMYQIATKPELALQLIPPHFSPELQDVLRLCLAEDPAQRPSATQLLGHPFFCTVAQPNVVHPPQAAMPAAAPPAQQQQEQNRQMDGAARAHAAMSALEARAAANAMGQQQQQAPNGMQQQQQQPEPMVTSSYANKLRDETQNQQMGARPALAMAAQQQQFQQQQQQQYGNNNSNGMQQQQQPQRQQQGGTIKGTLRPGQFSQPQYAPQ